MSTLCAAHTHGLAGLPGPRSHRACTVARRPACQRLVAPWPLLECKTAGQLPHRATHTRERHTRSAAAAAAACPPRYDSLYAQDTPLEPYLSPAVALQESGGHARMSGVQQATRRGTRPPRASHTRAASGGVCLTAARNVARGELLAVAPPVVVVSGGGKVRLAGACACGIPGARAGLGGAAGRPPACCEPPARCTPPARVRATQGQPTQPELSSLVAAVQALLPQQPAPGTAHAWAVEWLLAFYRGEQGSLSAGSVGAGPPAVADAAAQAQEQAQARFQLLQRLLQQHGSGGAGGVADDAARALAASAATPTAPSLAERVVSCNSFSAPAQDFAAAKLRWAALLRLPWPRSAAVRGAPAPCVPWCSMQAHAAYASHQRHWPAPCWPCNPRAGVS